MIARKPFFLCEEEDLVVVPDGTGVMVPWKKCLPVLEAERSHPGGTPLLLPTQVP